MQEKEFTICAWFIPDNFPEQEAIIRKAAELCKKHNLSLCEIGLPLDLSNSIITSSSRNGITFEASGQNNFDSINKASIVLVNQTTFGGLESYNYPKVDFRPINFAEMNGLTLDDFLNGIEAELQRIPPKIQPQPNTSLLAYLYGFIAPFVPDFSFIWGTTAARPILSSTSPSVATSSGLDQSQRRAKEKMDALGM